VDLVHLGVEVNQQFLIFELAHSVHGRFKRVQLSYKALAFVAAAVVLVCFSGVALACYAAVAWKASQYQELRADLDQVRARYHDLQRQSVQHEVQMASLENLASEISAAYGLSQPDFGGRMMDSDSLPSLKESLEHYNFLIAASYSDIYHRYAYKWQTHAQPSIWPVDGALRSPFGGRSDPFSGEGAFHTGLDLQASTGTPVRVTADGVVESASYSGRYGKLVIVDHGNGIETYYAHLSQFLVIPGQEVRRGEYIALSGGTGRVTGPHLHYEVRLGGTPVNPYKYLGKPAQQFAGTKLRHSDLGL
jgi:murein DD-endopeptidase MepM/ murein hydrolase activator NlpD